MKRSSFQLLRDGESGRTRYVSFRPWDASMECQIVGHHRLARKCLRQGFGKLLVSSSCVKRSLAGKELKAPVLFFSRKSKGCRELELQIPTALQIADAPRILNMLDKTSTPPPFHLWWQTVMKFMSEVTELLGILGPSRTRLPFFRVAIYSASVMSFS